MFSCGICEIFKNSGVCFWEHVTLHNKKLCRAWISHIQCYPFTVIVTAIAFIVNLMMRHENQALLAWLWEEQADSRSVFQKWKEVLLMLYYINKNWYHFIKEYVERFSKFVFQEVACPVGQLEIFLKFYLPTDTLWMLKTVGRVLGHTTAGTHSHQITCLQCMKSSVLQ